MLLSPMSSPTLITAFFILAILVDIKWDFRVVLIHIFLMIIAVGYLSDVSLLLDEDSNHKTFIYLFFFSHLTPSDLGAIYLDLESSTQMI